MEAFLVRLLQAARGEAGPNRSKKRGIWAGAISSRAYWRISSGCCRMSNA